MQQKTSTSLRKVLAKHHGISAVRSTGACLQVLKQLSGAKALKATAKSQVHCADASAVAKFQEGLEKGRTQKRLLPFEIVSFPSLTVPERTSPLGADLLEDEEL